MSRIGTPLRARWIPAAAALLVACAVAAMALLGAVALTGLRSDTEVRASAAQAVAPVSEALRLAQEGAATGGVAVPGAQQVEVADASAAGISEASATRARDTGKPVLDEAGGGSVVVATYRTPTPPANVEDRRRQVTGIVVAPLSLGPVLDEVRLDDGGIAVAGPDQVVEAVPRAAPEGATTFASELARGVAPGWSVVVWKPEPSIPTRAWVVAGVLVLAGLATAAALMRRADRAHRSRAELERLQEASARTAALATVAQQSLDLADVLPAITTELSNDLGLRALTLSGPSSSGERLFFAWGEPPPLTPTARTLPTQIAAGETVTLLLSRGGRTIAKLCVVAGRDLDRHDVTSLGAAADILASALANAEAFAQQRDLVHRMRSVDELKTVFLATASHELRTPVTAITGYARILADSLDRLTPEQTRTYADRIDGNAQRLGTLVEDLLDFSRLERGLGGADDAEIDLGELVDRILQEQPDVATDHELVRKTSPGLVVRGSVQAVERVLTNLVGNAAKYSPSGTTIRVTVREAGGRAELSVADEGPGVPAAERDHIFSRFFRGGGDEVVRTHGAGLGLAIVSEFAASMGGRVSVTAADSGGALFVVTYPLVDTPRESPAEQQHQGTPEGATHVDA